MITSCLWDFCSSFWLFLYLPWLPGIMGTSLLAKGLGNKRPFPPTWLLLLKRKEDGYGYCHTEEGRVCKESEMESA